MGHFPLGKRLQSSGASGFMASFLDGPPLWWRRALAHLALKARGFLLRAHADAWGGGGARLSIYPSFGVTGERPSHTVSFVWPLVLLSPFRGRPKYPDM